MMVAPVDRQDRLFYEFDLDGCGEHLVEHDITPHIPVWDQSEVAAGGKGFGLVFEVLVRIGIGPGTASESRQRPTRLSRILGPPRFRYAPTDSRRTPRLTDRRGAPIRGPSPGRKPDTGYGPRRDSPTPAVSHQTPSPWGSRPPRSYEKAWKKSVWRQ